MGGSELLVRKREQKRTEAGQRQGDSNHVIEGAARGL